MSNYGRRVYIQRLHGGHKDLSFTWAKMAMSAFMMMHPDIAEIIDLKYAKKKKNSSYFLGVGNK